MSERKIVLRGGKVCVVRDDVVVAVFDRARDRRYNFVAAQGYLDGTTAPTSGDAAPVGEADPLAGLTDRQLAMREAFEAIEDAFGSWNQTAGADGAHYAPGAANPFKAQGLTCANCTFWEPAPTVEYAVDALDEVFCAGCKKRGKAGCEEHDVAACGQDGCATCVRHEAAACKKKQMAAATGYCGIVSGDIDPDAVCKLWIISADKVREKADLQGGVAGLVVRAGDTGRVLMLQRALDDLADDDSPDAAGTWEFPGGKVDPGEDPMDTAMREWQEEIGVELPVDANAVTAGWTSGVYQGFVVDVAAEADIAINLPMDQRPVNNPDDLSQTTAWWNPDDLGALSCLRAELMDSIDVWMPVICMPTQTPDGPGMDGPGMDGVRVAISVNGRPEEIARALARTVTPPAVSEGFVLDVDGRTFLTMKADVGLNYWAGPPRGAGEHMLWMQGRYVGGDRPNRNGTMWTAADLQSGFPTVAGTPLNWLHEERRIIGSLVDAKLVGPSVQTAAATGDPHIAALAGVWKWVYPQEAYTIAQTADAGNLHLSMECVADQVQCAGEDGCGASVSYDRFLAGDTCQHLKERGSVKRLINPTFLGAGVIVPPSRPGWADADARVMAMTQDAFSQAGRPADSTTGWEALVAEVLRFAATRAGIQEARFD